MGGGGDMVVGFVVSYFLPVVQLRVLVSIGIGLRWFLTNNNQDISARNILFTAKSLAHLDQEQISDILGSPENHELKRKDGKSLRKGLPKHIVKATTWAHWTPDGEDIRIIDFGEAFKQGEEPKVLRQPGSLQVPELILGEGLDFRVDLWRVGITVSENWGFQLGV